MSRGTHIWTKVPPEEGLAIAQRGMLAKINSCLSAASGAEVTFLDALLPAAHI